MYNSTEVPKGKFHVFYARINFSNIGAPGRGGTKKKKSEKEEQMKSKVSRKKKMKTSEIQ